MAAIAVSASRFVDAAPAVVFAIIADYRQGHPRILPERWFGPLTVEEGGVGAGTRIRFTMKGFGKPRELTARVEVPEPGRVLVERYPETGGVTTFTVDPVGGGSTVTITTSWTARGFQGLVERVLAPLYLRRVYRAELDMLQLLSESGFDPAAAAERSP